MKNQKGLRMLGRLAAFLWFAAFCHLAAAQATYVASNTANNESSSRSLTVPNDADAGDLLLALIAVREVSGCNSISAVPSGWTLETCSSGGSSSVTMAVYSKLTTVDEGGTSYTWSGWSNKRNSGILAVYRGTSGVDVKDSLLRTNSSTARAPSVTTTAADERVVAFYAIDRGSATITTSGMTDRAVVTSNVASRVSDFVQASAGATGNKNATLNDSYDSVGAQVALKPIAVLTSPTVSYPAPAATSISATGATLNGTVSSNGALTTVVFEHGPTAAYGNQITLPSQLAAGAVNSAVSTSIGGLNCGTSGTPYYFRVTATNSAGTTTGAGQSFTVPCAPTVTTGAASGVTATGATLNGTVSSNGSTTSTFFQYGTDASYGTQVAASPASLGAAAANSAISLALSNLACDTTYHFRASATNAGGTRNGDDATFKTPLCPVKLAKTASTAAAAVDSYVTFNLKATNPNGLTALSNIVITDTIPAGMVYNTHVATLGTASISGQTLTWSILSLPPGASVQLTLVVKLTAKGTFTNTISSPGATSSSADILVLPSAITHYRLDETLGSWTGATGEVIDAGGNGLHGHRRPANASGTNTVLPGTTILPGKVSPSPTIASQRPSVVGGFCNAGYFDGNGVVESASSEFFQFGQTLSASVWVYPTAYNSGLSSILSNDVNYEFHLDSGGHLYWWWQASNFTSAGTIPLNQWTHIAITFDSTAANKRQYIYINGVRDANTNNWSGTLAKNTCPFYLGGDILTDGHCTLATDRNFHGMIDEAKIYNYELSAAEVIADMNLGRQCSGNFDHIRIEHDGAASTCAPKTVTVKACLDASCTALYPGAVTVQLSPSGWTPADIVTINGGVATATLNNASISAPTLKLGTVSVTPTPTNATRCFNGATETCLLSVAAASSCNADAVEAGAAARTNIFTKLAGTAFSVDLLALLNGTSTLDTAYQGTMIYDLVDTSSAACSGSSTALTTAKSYTFDKNVDGGRKTVSMTCPTAASSVQVRIKTGATYACSTDKFSIRPSAATLTSTDAKAYNASDLTMTGTPPSATASPVVKAGAVFSIGATTAPNSYAGILALDSSKLTAQSSVIGSTPASGGTVGTLTLDTITVGGVNYTSSVQANAASPGGAHYNEVGYLYANPGAVSDGGSLTTVDRTATCAASNTCDCWMPTADSNDTRYLSDTLVSGRYGCYVGNKASFVFGRFIPDHFDTVATGSMSCATLPPFNPVCPTGGLALVYSGQPISTTVSARALGGELTQNYAGVFARNVMLQAWDGLGSTTLELTTGGTDRVGDLSANTVAMATFALGAATPTPPPTFDFRAIPTAPTSVFLRAVESPAGSPAGDGVTSLRATDPTNTSVEGGVKVIKGRLAVSNATGSERRDLVIPIEAQYWSGQSWMLNSADVTALAVTAANVTDDPSSVNPIAALATPTLAAVLGSPGRWTLTLKAPNKAGSANVALNLGTAGNDTSCLTVHGGTAAGVAWLRSGTCAGGVAGTADPSARATFGIYAPETRRTVHTRELF